VRVIRAIQVFLLLQIRDDKYNLELMRRMGLQEIYPYKRKSFSLPEFNKKGYFFQQLGEATSGPGIPHALRGIFWIYSQ